MLGKCSTTELHSSALSLFTYKSGLFSIQSILPIYVCVRTMCVLDSLRGQKRSLAPLELELWVAVSHSVGARNLTWVLCE